MKELHNIKANVDYLLDIPASQEQQKTSKNPDNSFMLLPVFSVPKERAAARQVTIYGFGDMSPTSILEGFTATGDPLKYAILRKIALLAVVS